MFRVYKDSDLILETEKNVDVGDCMFYKGKVYQVDCILTDMEGEKTCFVSETPLTEDMDDYISTFLGKY